VHAQLKHSEKHAAQAGRISNFLYVIARDVENKISKICDCPSMHSIFKTAMFAQFYKKF